MRDLVPLGMALYTSREAIDPIEWQVEGKLVRANVIAEPAAVAAQTKGIAGYLERVCGVRDPALVARLGAVRAIYGLNAEAGLDPAHATARFWELARAQDALVFHRGAFFDAQGQCLAAPAGNTAEPPDAQEEEPEDTPVGPPTAMRAAARARVLAAIGTRAILEGSERQDDHAELEELRTWVEREGLEGELEEEEQGTLFEPTIGGMGRQERIDAMWRFEGAAVLAWALGLLPLPPHDQVVDIRELARAVGLSEPAPEGVRAPRLRPADEIVAMRERIFSIHWRLVDFRIRPVALDFPEVARRSTFGLVTDAAMLIGSDLAVRGRPIAEADPRDVGLASSIARERHQAANWLVGDAYGPTYSGVGTDT